MSTTPTSGQSPLPVSPTPGQPQPVTNESRVRPAQSDPTTRIPDDVLMHAMNFMNRPSRNAIAGTSVNLARVNVQKELSSLSNLINFLKTHLEQRPEYRPIIDQLNRMNAAIASQMNSPTIIVNINSILKDIKSSLIQLLRDVRVEDLRGIENLSMPTFFENFARIIPLFSNFTRAIQTNAPNSWEMVRDIHNLGEKDLSVYMFNALPPLGKINFLADQARTSALQGNVQQAREMMDQAYNIYNNTRPRMEKTQISGLRGAYTELSKAANALGVARGTKAGDEFREDVVKFQSIFQDLSPLPFLQTIVDPAIRARAQAFYDAQQ